MSEENLALAQGFADAVNRRDADWIIDRITDDFEFIPIRGATEGAFRGAEGIRRFLRDTEENFDAFEVSIDELESVENRVIGAATIRIRGKGSGIETEIPSAAVMIFRDGRIARFEDYGDRRRAFEAAGLG